jgi:uncharacterized membrane protein
VSLDASSKALSDAEAISLIQQRCRSCHSATPTDELFTTAPAGVIYDTKKQIMNWLPRIHARAVISKDMPFMNKTGMTDKERIALADWLQKN